MTRAGFAVHGHFYQPSRSDPFTGRTIQDGRAAPYPDWTSRIAAECYGPNAAAGNFGRIGWDLGPTLATWLRRERPEIHAAIAAQESGRNGLAQAYHHAILPLATDRDVRTEIRWGLRDFELRFGHRPAGIWLPETAVDLRALRVASEEGVRYTILAPWQAVGPVESRTPYRVDVGGGHQLIVLFYDGLLSAAVSFEPAATEDADRFLASRIAPRLAEPPASHTGGERLVLIATDGELYGHHQRFRDLFLAHLTQAPAGASEVPPPLTAGDLVQELDPAELPPVVIRERTSWSCHHGIARWHAECPDATDGRWKAPLREAVDRLAAELDTVSVVGAAEAGTDLWAARDGFVEVVSELAGETGPAGMPGVAVPAARGVARAARDESRLVRLLEAQQSRLAMFASDGWYWEDPTRPETAQVLRFAAHAARTVDAELDTQLEQRLVRRLGRVPLPGGGGDGRRLYEAALEVVGQRPPRPVG